MNWQIPLCKTAASDYKGMIAGECRVVVSPTCLSDLHISGQAPEGFRSVLIEDILFMCVATEESSHALDRSDHQSCDRTRLIPECFLFAAVFRRRT
jgi:hypothetical protein